MKHDGAVESVQFSPDGKRIVTVSADKTARVWDAQGGPPLTGPLHHGDAVMSAQFSADGKRVVTASYDHTARVWDAERLRRIRQLGCGTLRQPKRGDRK